MTTLPPVHSRLSLNSDTVRFGAKQNASAHRKASRLLAATGIAAAGLLLPAQAAMAQGANSTDTYEGMDCARVVSNADVNDAEDLPQGVYDNPAVIYDLADSPLFTPEQCHAISSILQEVYEEEWGEFKLVVIPDTEAGNIEALSQDIFNADGGDDRGLALGAPGENDGGLLLVVKDRFLNNESGKMAWQPGAGIKGEYGSSFTEEIGRNVMNVYLDDIEDAHRSGNMAEAQRLAGEAIEETIDRARDRLAEYRADNPRLTPEQRAAQEEADRLAAERQKEIFFNILKVLGGVVVAAGAGGIGVAAIRAEAKRRRTLQEKVDLVKQPLLEMESPYAVNRRNVFSRETLDALLDDETNARGAHADPATLMPAIGLVLAEVSRKVKATEGKDDDEALTLLLVEEGLNHPLPEVRRTIVEVLASPDLDPNGGLNREDDYEPFMELLKSEQDVEVIQVLSKVLLEMTGPEDAADFRQVLRSTEDVGVKTLAVHVLAKYADESTVGEFFSLLETEKNPHLVEGLQTYISRLAKPAHQPLLLGKLADRQNDPVRQAAVTALGTLGDPETFEPLHDAFLAEEAGDLDTAYADALTATAEENHVARLVSGLAQGDVRADKVTLVVLEDLSSPAAVRPLLDYLELPEAKAVAEAASALTASVSEESRPILLDEIHSNDPKTENVDVMLAAVAGLRKLGNSEDLDDLVAAMEKGHSPNVQKALYQAMEESAHTEQSFEFLEDMLMGSGSVEVRVAAAFTLDNYGLRALPVLFEALGRTNVNTASAEVDAIRKAIMTVAQDERALESLVKASHNRNERVRSVAATAAVNIIESWTRHDYGNSQIKKRLDKLGKDRNPDIAAAAGRVYESLARTKARELDRLGSSGRFSRSSSDYSTVSGYENDSDPRVRRAARDARSELDRRRRRHEAEERRRREAARRAAEAAARRRRSYSSSSSSSSFGGFSGGGGFSSGGGSSW